jgi:hypothetical protein
MRVVMAHKVSYRLLVPCICIILAVPAAVDIALGQEKIAKLSGQNVFQNKCLQCHKQSKFKDLHYARREWEQIVTRMERNTCVLSDVEYNAVCEYLAKEHGE